jgi:pimeloyl-ACP methyl ester carboxylesterase
MKVRDVLSPGVERFDARAGDVRLHCAAVRVERIPEASHWVQADAPERVNELLRSFLQ